jgi:hypothetical protein
MTRVILATLALSAILPSTAIAQVKIIVLAQQYNVQEKIHAKIENRGNAAVTFCVEAGQTSSTEGEIESTTSPFWVQRSSNGKWGTLMIGPDVGSFRSAVVLGAHESKEFIFLLSDSGSLRLRLNYWRGSISDLDCHAPPKGVNLVTSRVFTTK